MKSNEPSVKTSLLPCFSYFMTLTVTDAVSKDAGPVVSSRIDPRYAKVIEGNLYLVYCGFVLERGFCRLRVQIKSVLVIDFPL